MSPQALQLAATVFKVIQDVEFLVYRSDEHINAEVRAFLTGIGCSGATLSQSGY